MLIFFSMVLSFSLSCNFPDANKLTVLSTRDIARLTHTEILSIRKLLNKIY